jgi:hypothetical protein
VTPSAVLAQRAVAIDVLEDDDRVVDHAPDGDRQAAQVMMLRLIPVSCMTTSAVRIDSGMLIAATSVDRRLNRNRKIVRTANRRPGRPRGAARPATP